MKTEVLNCILKNIYKLTHSPVVIYDGNTIVREFHQSKWLALTAFYEKAVDTEDEFNLFISPQSLAFAMVKYGKLKIVFGPVKIVKLSPQMIREITLDNGYNLDDVKKIIEFLDYIPTMQIEYFAELAASYYVEIRHEIITANDFLSKLQYKYSDTDIDSLLLQKQSQIVYGNKMPHNTYEYEQKMLYSVKNGLVEDLHKLGNLSPDQNVDVIVPDTLRHYKNMVMAQKTLISRAAIEGGVDPETAYSLSDIYSHKIENCSTFKEISELSYSIRDSFCKMVRDIKQPKANDLIINKALSYINKNITEKITAAEVAEYLGISREYLSLKFKKIMGQSISEYANHQKINIAKKLLKFSDQTLISISNYLSFSSQSSFQTIFKKVTGITPLEYRNSGD